jgi:nucleoside-diphosphate-sugar epimerase
MISRAERLRGSLTGTKPLLTPDRALELSQHDWTCDDTHARLDIDYESTISLPDGMRMTAEWYRVHGFLAR